VVPDVLSPFVALRQLIVHDDDECKEDHAAEDDVETGILAHDRRFPPSRNAAPSNASHMTKPRTAIPVENRRSPNNCPKTSAPSARFAASGSLSMSIVGCSRVNPTIVEIRATA
jgi:hypothetical protein